MCTYVVTYRVIGECNVVVEASNASDAIDKLYYKSLTDESIDVNKSDLKIRIDIDKEKWAVKEEEIEEFAKRKGLQYYGVSAKHNMNINYGFDDLANKIHDKLKQK